MGQSEIDDLYETLVSFIKDQYLTLCNTAKVRELNSFEMKLLIKTTDIYAKLEPIREV